MEYLINIQSKKIGTVLNSVNAMELHSFIESKTQYSHWITRRIEKYDFIENQDYIIVETRTAGRPLKEYFITLDVAKELCMVENNEKGREARRYFIEAEKQLLNQNSSNSSDLQKVISGLKSGMTRKDKKIQRLEDEIQQLKIEHQKRVAIPHFSQNQKIDIILRNTENLLKQDGILPFQDMVKTRFDFMKNYIEAIRTGGTKLQMFTIDTIEDYKNKYIQESKQRVLVEHNYNLMIDKVREYIKVANQLSLLEPIGGDL